MSDVCCCKDACDINMSSSDGSIPPRSSSSHFRGSRPYSSSLPKARRNVHRFVASAGENGVARVSLSKTDTRRPGIQSSNESHTSLSKILEALAVLQEDVNKFKCDRGDSGSIGSEPGTSGLRSGPAMDLGGDHAISTSPPPSTSADFSGFTSQEVSAAEGEIVEEVPSGSILSQAAKAYVSVVDCSAAIEEPIAAMVNHWFSQGLKEDGY